MYVFIVVAGTYCTVSNMTTETEYANNFDVNRNSIHLVTMVTTGPR